MRPARGGRARGRRADGAVSGHKKTHGIFPCVSGKMVGPVRFELTTSCTPCKRATRLRYGPTSQRKEEEAPRPGPRQVIISTDGKSARARCTGVPGVTRTRNRLLRRQELYPVELRGQTGALTDASPPRLQYFFLEPPESIRLSTGATRAKAEVRKKRMVEQIGIKPTTSSLRTTRSIN